MTQYVLEDHVWQVVDSDISELFVLITRITRITRNNHIIVITIIQHVALPTHSMVVLLMDHLRTVIIDTNDRQTIVLNFN